MKAPKRASKSANRAGPIPSASACRMNGSKSPDDSASAKVMRSNACPLVMVEWEDSAKAMPNWTYLASFRPPDTIRCVSVGWLIRNDHDMKAVASNMGAIGRKQRAGVRSDPDTHTLHNQSVSPEGGKAYLPFFSSCDSTEAASRLASAAVGFLAPLSTLAAKDETGGVDCLRATFNLPLTLESYVCYGCRAQGLGALSAVS